MDSRACVRFLLHATAYIFFHSIPSTYVKLHTQKEKERGERTPYFAYLGMHPFYTSFILISFICCFGANEERVCGAFYFSS